VELCRTSRIPTSEETAKGFHPCESKTEIQLASEGQAFPLLALEPRISISTLRDQDTR
jgi:hypothetical protein